MNIIREFLEWRKNTAHFQEIDIDDNTKERLRALGRDNSDIINALIQKTKANFLSKCITEDVSLEYMRGVKYTLDYIR